MGHGKVVKICRLCAEEFGLTEIVKQQQNISHGTCDVHFILTMMEHRLEPKRLKAHVENWSKIPKKNGAPFLKQHPELVKKYKQGIFDEPVVI